MNVNPVIFRDYDIRGVVPSDLDPVISENIGLAFGTFLNGEYGTNVVVGHDNRKSSVELKDKFVYGLISSGCNVTDIGLSLTPIVQFLTYDKKFDAGVIVTASHNPKEFNGFRFVGKKGEPIFGDDLRQILEITNSQTYKKGNGTVGYEDLHHKYISYMRENFSFSKNFKVAVDCGNGTTSSFVPAILKELGVEVFEIFCNLDGDYPHGIPDPENPLFMGGLSESIKLGSYDVGFGFDTDGDRLGVVDEKGNIYETDKLLLLLASSVLKNHKDGKILFDVKSSGLLEVEIVKFGGEPVMLRTGHPYFITAIKNGALVGSEFSGHTFFGDKYFGFDDGIYAALRVLEILDNSDMSLSELFKVFPKTYHTQELKLPCSESEKKDLVDKVSKFVSSNIAVNKVVDIDGIRAYMGDKSWFLVRASNTNPYISIRFESDTEEGVNNEIGFLCNILPSLNNLKPIPIHFS